MSPTSTWSLNPALQKIGAHSLHYCTRTRRRALFQTLCGFSAAFKSLPLALQRPLQAAMAQPHKWHNVWSFSMTKTRQFAITDTGRICAKFVGVDAGDYIFFKYWPHNSTVRATLCNVMFSNSFSGALPLASLRLMASPLQLTYSYIWQVVRQKNVKQYGKVEEFVTMVVQTVPDLMSFKQTAQLILGLRARVSCLCVCIKC